MAYYILHSPIFELWTLTDFLLTQVKASSDRPKVNYILHSLYKSGMISTICHKFGKSFIKIIPLPALYGMTITSNNFLI